jgi:hypothetical protein
MHGRDAFMCSLAVDECLQHLDADYLVDRDPDRRCQGLVAAAVSRQICSLLAIRAPKLGTCVIQHALTHPCLVQQALRSMQPVRFPAVATSACAIQFPCENLKQVCRADEMSRAFFRKRTL